MKVFHNIAGSWRDSFFADRVLFPSKSVRVALWVAAALGGVAVAFVILATRLVFHPVVFLLILIGFLTYWLSLVWWIARATRYICDKEQGRED